MDTVCTPGRTARMRQSISPVAGIRRAGVSTASPSPTARAMASGLATLGRADRHHRRVARPQGPRAEPGLQGDEDQHHRNEQHQEGLQREEHVAAVEAHEAPLGAQDDPGVVAEQPQSQQAGLDGVLDRPHPALVGQTAEGEQDGDGQEEGEHGDDPHRRQRAEHAYRAIDPPRDQEAGAIARDSTRRSPGPSAARARARPRRAPCLAQRAFQRVLDEFFHRAVAGGLRVVLAAFEQIRVERHLGAEHGIGSP